MADDNLLVLISTGELHEPCSEVDLVAQHRVLTSTPTGADDSGEHSSSCDAYST